MSKGFTLVELLVVTAIIVLMTALILPNYRTSDKQLALQRVTYKLAQDLRGTQEMAMSAKEFQGQIPLRYGIEFKTGINYYILFADMNDNGKYEPPAPDIEVERITLEKGVKIQDLLTPSSQTLVWVAFKPPDPLTTIRDPGERSTLRIQLINANNQTRTICVNKAGLITVGDCPVSPVTDVCAGVPNNTQVPGCNGTCQACQSGVCSYATAGTDPGRQCTQGSTASDGCRSDNCSGTSAACASYQTSGDGGCPACKTCVGATSIACANYINNTQDTGCNSTCQACQSGSCGVANAATDPGNLCGTTGCYTGNCKGGTAVCGYYTSDQHNCSACNTCNTSGNCTATANTSCGANLYGCIGATYRCVSGVCSTGLANGTACSADASCCSGICGTDADNDGYFSQALGRTGTCQATSKPYTDCYDANANAKPGQTSYFTTNRGDGSFDYNCDGVATKECATVTGLSLTCVTSLPAGKNGWVSSAPACGASGRMRWCRGYAGTSCAGSPEYNDVCGGGCIGPATSWRGIESPDTIVQKCR